MRYEFRLRLMEMLRLEREIEYRTPGARAGFWALFFPLGMLCLLFLGDYLDHGEISRKSLLAIPVVVAFYVIRFVYITVRRLRKVRRWWGSIWSSPLYRIACQPEQLVVECDGRRRSLPWDTVGLVEKPSFIVFLFDFDGPMASGCHLPKRVIPPDELPKLLAFLAERIPPKPPVPAHSPLDPPVA